MNSATVGNMTQSAVTVGSPATPKKSFGLRGILEDMKEFKRISKLQGGLVPQSAAATALGISRQRVHQLVTEGTLSHWTFYGMKWLSENELVSFAKLHRGEGENQYRPSAKEMWKAAREGGKEFVKGRRGQSGS
jgi:hypothetical protein